MESILLETMFDLPAMNGVEEVVISKDVVDGTAKPLLIYADKQNGKATVLDWKAYRFASGLGQRAFDVAALKR